MKRLARAGAQEAAVTWHCSKVVPLATSLSRLGVMQWSKPSAEMVSYLCWSVIIKMILGLSFMLTEYQLDKKLTKGLKSLFCGSFRIRKCKCFSRNITGIINFFETIANWFHFCMTITTGFTIAVGKVNMSEHICIWFYGCQYPPLQCSCEKDLQVLLHHLYWGFKIYMLLQINWISSFRIDLMVRKWRKCHGLLHDHLVPQELP